MFLIQDITYHFSLLFDKNSYNKKYQSDHKENLIERSLNTGDQKVHNIQNIILS